MFIKINMNIKGDGAVGKTCVLISRYKIALFII